MANDNKIRDVVNWHVDVLTLGRVERERSLTFHQMFAKHVNYRLSDAIVT